MSIPRTSALGGSGPDFTGCGPSAAVAEVLHDRLAGLGVPVAAGLPAGHGHVQLTVPLGVRAEPTAARRPGPGHPGARGAPLSPRAAAEHDTTDDDRKDSHPCAS